MALTTYTELKAAVADYLARGDLTTQIVDFIHLAEKRVESEINYVPNANDTFTDSATMTADQAYIYGPYGCVEPTYLRLETDPIRTLDVVTMREFARLQQANTSGIPRALLTTHGTRTWNVSAFATAVAGSKTKATLTEDHDFTVGDKLEIFGTTDYDGLQTIATLPGGETTNFVFSAAWVDDQAPATVHEYRMKILFDEAPTGAYSYTLFYKANHTYLKDGDANGTSWLLANWPQLLLYGALTEAMPFIKNDSRMSTWIAMFGHAIKLLKRQQWRRRVGGGELRVKVDFAIP